MPTQKFNFTILDTEDDDPLAIAPKPTPVNVSLPDEPAAPSGIAGFDKRLSDAVKITSQPAATTVRSALDIVSRPGAATAGIGRSFARGEGLAEGISRLGKNLFGPIGGEKDDFSDVLGDLGMKESASRNLLGFGADMIVDPTNIGGGALLRGPAKLATRTAGKIADVVPGVKATKQAAKEAFVPYAALESIPQYQQMRRTLDINKRAVPDIKKQEIIDRYKGQTPEFRQDLALALDKPNYVGIPQLAEKHPSVSVEDIRSSVLGTRAANQAQFQREVAAKVMKPTHENPNYVPYVSADMPGERGLSIHNPLSTRAGFQKRKTSESLADVVAGGGKADIAHLQFGREVRGDRAIANANFLSDTVNQFGTKLNKKQLPVPGTRKLDLKTMGMYPALHKEFKNTAFPDVIADDLQKLFVINEDPSKFLKFYDEAQRLWKSTATVVRPGHHTTNMIGNVFNAWLGGLENPTAYAMSAMWNTTKAPAKIGQFAKAELDEAMAKFGIAGRSSTYLRELDTDISYQLDRGLKGTKFELGDLNPLRAGRQLGSKVEDFGRRALFLDRVRKGDTLEQAAMHTKKYLFDYSELTDLERKYLTRVFPFYTWTRKNIPLQLESLINRPDKYAKVADVQNYVGNEVERKGNRVPEGMQPEYVQESGGLQVPYSDEQGRVKYRTINLPIFDLNKVPMPFGNAPPDTLKDLGNMLNPALKAGVELGMNKSMFFERPLYDKEYGDGWMETLMQPQKAPELLGSLGIGTPRPTKAGGMQRETPFALNYALQQVPLMSAGGKLASTFSQPEGDSGKRQLIEGPGGMKIDPLAFQQFMTGIRDNLQTPREQVNTAQRNRQSDIRKMKKQLKKTVEFKF